MKIKKIYIAMIAMALLVSTSAFARDYESKKTNNSSNLKNNYYKAPQNRPDTMREHERELDEHRIDEDRNNSAVRREETDKHSIENDRRDINDNIDRNRDRNREIERDNDRDRDFDQDRDDNRDRDFDRDRDDEPSNSDRNGQRPR
ncbi:hypothetical protein IJ670_04050 [bacterium]|nr:hypothetical protein [bacterium]